MAYKKRSGGGVDWFCPVTRAVALGAVAANGQVTLSDDTFLHPGTNQAYGAGALVGLRCWCDVFPNAATLGPVEFVAMILPAGLAVPNVQTAAQKKANENYIWFEAFGVYRETGTTSRVELQLSMGTVRRFNMNERLVIVVINRGTAAFGAASEGAVLIDAYIRED